MLAASAGGAVAAGLPAIRSSAANAVPACVTADRLTAFLRSRNPGLDARFTGIAGEYIRQGEELRLRWDTAFFQMMVDTANLTFRRSNGEPGVVRATQNNFAGLGATGAGVPGESFADVATGVKAHLQHVLMYAGETIAAPVAERTRKVQEWGLLASWQKSIAGPMTFGDLARKWSPGDGSYAAGIAAVARRFYDGHCAPSEALASRPAGGEHTTPSGVDLARQANQRARSEGNDARMALGVNTYENTTPTESNAGVGPLVFGPKIVAGRSSLAAAGHAPMAPPAAAAPSPPPATPAVAAPRTAAAIIPVDPAAEAIRTLVVGRTFVIDAAFGATIPVLFRPDGTMQGRAGSLAGILGAATDEGRWWTARGRLCQRWNIWLDKEVQCIKLRQSGSVIHWVRDDGKTGTARLASR